MSDRDAAFYSACALSNEQGPIPGNLSEGIVSARYEWEVRGMQQAPLGLFAYMQSLFPNPLRPGTGVLRGQCRNLSEALVDTSLDTSACTSIPFADANGILKCSVGSRLDSLRWTSRRAKCTEFVLTDFRLTSTCGEIADVRQCAGGISADTNKLRCSPDVPPAGPYQDSCVGITFERGILTAACQTLRGGYSTLHGFNVSGCNQPINNHNGKLMCGDIPSSTVPDLVGQTLGQAKNSLAQVRLNLGRLNTNGLLGTDETLVVLSHTPAAGVSAVQGSAVDLSLGLKPTAGGTSGTKVCDGKEPKFLVYCSACKDNICSDQEKLENNGVCKPTLFQDQGFVCSEESAESFLRQKYGYQCPFTKGACKF